jgi:hypothetical protein
MKYWFRARAYPCPCPTSLKIPIKKIVPDSNMCTCKIFPNLNERVLYNKYYEKFSEFKEAILDFLQSLAESFQMIEEELHNKGRELILRIVAMLTKMAKVHS